MRRTVMVSALVLTLAATGAAAVDRYGLYVVPRAVEVDRKLLRLKHSVHYYVPEAYPAHETLLLIKQSLANAGWRPATCDDLGQYERSSHTEGWKEVSSDDSPMSAQLWSGTWVNARGDRVNYSLAYRASTPGGLQPTHLQVAASQESRKDAEQRRRMSDGHMDRLRANYPYLRAPKPCQQERAGEQ